MKINVDELQEALTTLLLRLKDYRGDGVELKEDYYWDFCSDEMFDFSKKPVDFSIGQLTDDWETIKNNVKSDTLIAYDLERLSKILIVLSIENPGF